MNDNVMDSIGHLRKNIQQNMFDIDFFLKEQAKGIDNNKLETVNDESANMKSMFLNLKSSIYNYGYGNNNNNNYDNFKNNDTTNNNNGSDMNHIDNDTILNGIFDKLQVNLVSASEIPLKNHSVSTEEYQMLVKKHIEQFKKELNWYEERKDHHFEIAINEQIEENKKLQIQISKLKERWSNLVESARQRRNR